MIRFRHSLLLALVPCVALAQDAGSTKSPTAGIDKPPRSLSSMQFSRTGGVDATGVGGFVGIPASNGTVVVPMNPKPPGTPPPPPGGGIKAPVFDRSYTAISTYSHDARAWLDLEIAPDGTCTVTTFALKTSGERKYSCGNVLDGASPSDVEVQFIADVYILNGTPPQCGNPFYTPSTDWIPLADFPKVHADTGLVVGGGSPCSGSKEVSGNYTVRIRQKSTGVIVQAVMDSFLVEAGA